MKKYRIFVLLFLVLGLCWGLRLYMLIQPEGLFPLKLKWQADLGYSSYERPTYQDGLIFLPASNIIGSYAYGLIGTYWYGIDSTTGRIVWSQQAGLYDFRRCLTKAYLVLSGSYSFKVLRTHTGEIVWQGERAQTASCSEETVFLSEVPRDTIRAVDLTTGQRLWAGTTPVKSFIGLIYNPEVEEIIAEESNVPGDMYIVDAKSGFLKHSFARIKYAPDDSNTARGAMYLVDRGELFLEGTVLDARTGQVIHKEDRYGSITPPIVTTDTMYLSALSDGVVAFDRATYNVKWVYQPQAKIQWIPPNTLSPVAILDGIGYVIFSDATLRAFDLETGQELGYWQLRLFDLWHWPICTFPPIPDCVGTARAGLATSDDTLFVSFGDGRVYAFGR
jgi:outer membrane protein assembly factor BamB